jgi:hypothetical protein
MADIGGCMAWHLLSHALSQKQYLKQPQHRIATFERFSFSVKNINMANIFALSQGVLCVVT